MVLNFLQGKTSRRAIELVILLSLGLGLGACATGDGEGLIDMGSASVSEEEKAIMLETEKLAAGGKADQEQKSDNSESTSAVAPKSKAIGFSDYLDFLKKRLAKIQKGDPLRNQWVYARYLEKKDPRYALVYSKRLLRYAKAKKRPLVKEELGVFSAGLCLEKNKSCVYSMQEATDEFFVPALEKGKKEALRLLAVYAESMDIAGEEKKIESLFANNAKVAAHKGRYQAYRKQAKKFLGFDGQ